MEESLKKPATFHLFWETLQRNALIPEARKVGWVCVGVGGGGMWEEGDIGRVREKTNWEGGERRHDNEPYLWHILLFLWRLRSQSCGSVKDRTTDCRYEGRETVVCVGDCVCLSEAVNPPSSSTAGCVFCLSDTGTAKKNKHPPLIKSALPHRQPRELLGSMNITTITSCNLPPSPLPPPASSLLDAPCYITSTAVWQPVFVTGRESKVEWMWVSLCAHAIPPLTSIDQHTGWTNQVCGVPWWAALTPGEHESPGPTPADQALPWVTGSTTCE